MHTFSFDSRSLAQMHCINHLGITAIFCTVPHLIWTDTLMARWGLLPLKFNRNYAHKRSGDVLSLYSVAVHWTSKCEIHRDVDASNKGWKSKINQKSTTMLHNYTMQIFVHLTVCSYTLLAGCSWLNICLACVSNRGHDLMVSQRGYCLSCLHSVKHGIIVMK